MTSMIHRERGEPTPICHIVTPVGMLGYGFNEEQNSDVLSTLVSTSVPTAIILDSGSTDSGPEKLALGHMSCPRSSYARDLSKLIRLSTKYKVPIIFTSAGGDGSNDHVKEILDIINEIAKQDEYDVTALEFVCKVYGIQLLTFISTIRPKTVAIFADVEKSLVKSRLKQGAITGCGKFVPPLTEESIEQSACIVAQLGPEPFIDAMIADPDFDVIVGGRAYDPSPYVAFAAFHAQALLKDASLDTRQQLFGAFTHMGKIMECGGQCASPKSQGAVSTVFTNGEFEISPTDPKAACTSLSVAAHTLYENTRPDILYGPGGYLDLTKSVYKPLSDSRSVRVSGSSFHSSRDEGLPYALKLEAARVTGYRTIFMGAIKDPILISQLDPLLQLIKRYVASQHPTVSNEQWKLDFHVQGRNTSEVFLVGEALADSQSLATSIASSARVATIHGPYPGQKATSGNFAFGIGGKLEIEMGPCAEFSIYHLMNLEVGEERLHSAVVTASDPESIMMKESLEIMHAVSVPGWGQSAKNSNFVTETVSAPIKVEGKVPTSHKRLTLSDPEVQAVCKPPVLPHNPVKLGDLARVLRSKNAGPYEITFDVMIGSADHYSKLKECGMLSKSSIAHAFALPEEQIIWCGFFDPALAFKVTIPRLRNGQPVSAGGFMENDVHGSQQYRPLYDMELPPGTFAQSSAT